MTYQELLLDEKWKARRKSILIKATYACSICNNSKIIDDSHKGLMKYSNQIRNGSLYNCFAINQVGQLYRKPIVLSNDLSLNDNGQNCYFAYLEPESEQQQFGRLIAVKRIDNAVKFNSPFEIIHYLQTDPKLLVTDDLSPNFQWLYSTALHVHHRYYQKNRLPWEYPDDALQALCWICHEELHQSSTVPYLDEHGNELRKLTPCGKCSGAGYLPQYKHIEHGICFQCNGAKYQEFIT